MALFNFDFASIFSAVKTFLGPIGKLLDYLQQSFDHLKTIFERAQTLVQSIIDEIKAWRAFKQDIRFKQRVVQIESAVQKTRDLIAGIPAAWKAIVDVVQQFKKQISDTPVEDTAAVVEDVEAGGLKALLKQFPRLAKGLERALAIFALIVQALEAISNSIDDIQTVVDEITRLREEIERLDTIFLSQSNKRKTLKLADGGTIRIRVGKLHS